MKIYAPTMLVAIVGICLSISPINAANRVALVIGNGAYEKVPVLPNPTRDAADIGDSLSRLGFAVTRLSNGNASAMRKSIVEFGRTAEGSDMAIVFYAGHGMEAGGENWLIPIDAELRNDTDVESEAISLRSVSLQVSKAQQLGLVILDACRNNPFAAKMQRSLRVRAVTRGLAPIEPTDNVLIAYAARDGTTANDGEGRNSPFTAALLHNLETPGLEISFLFRNVRDEVMSTTKREQQPFVYGSLSKEAIYFKPLVPAPTLIAPSTTIAKLPTEQDTRKDGTAVPSGLKRNAYLPQDARRITAVAVEQELKMPPFAIGETKSSVSESYAQFVGIWSNKAGFHGGRHVMLVITEITSDGVAVGYYLWGPPGKLSWAKNDPAGYVNFAGKITDGKLEFKSGEVPMDAMLSGASMTLHSVNPHRQKGQSKDAAIKLSPLWRLSILGSTVPEQPSDRQHAAPAATTKPRPSKQKAELDGDARPGRIVGLSMEDRYRACRKLVKGFAQREACARNGGI